MIDECAEIDVNRRVATVPRCIGLLLGCILTVVAALSGQEDAASALSRLEGNDRLSRTTIESLCRLVIADRPNANRAVDALASEPGWLQRMRAIHLAQQLGGPECSERLVEAHRLQADPNWRVREAAMGILGRIDPHRAEAIAAGALADPVINVRDAATLALAHLDCRVQRSTIASLLARLDETSVGCRAAVLSMLEREPGWNPEIAAAIVREISRSDLPSDRRERLFLELDRRRRKAEFAWPLEGMRRDAATQIVCEWLDLLAGPTDAFALERLVDENSARGGRLNRRDGVIHHIAGHFSTAAAVDAFADSHWPDPRIVELRRAVAEASASPEALRTLRYQLVVAAMRQASPLDVLTDRITVIPRDRRRALLEKLFASDAEERHRLIAFRIWLEDRHADGRGRAMLDRAMDDRSSAVARDAMRRVWHGGDGAARARIVEKLTTRLGSYPDLAVDFVRRSADGGDPILLPLIDRMLESSIQRVRAAAAEALTQFEFSDVADRLRVIASEGGPGSTRAAQVLIEGGDREFVEWIIGRLGDETAGETLGESIAALRSIDDSRILETLERRLVGGSCSDRALPAVLSYIEARRDAASLIALVRRAIFPSRDSGDVAHPPDRNGNVLDWLVRRVGDPGFARDVFELALSGEVRIPESAIEGAVSVLENDVAGAAIVERLAAAHAESLAKGDGESADWLAGLLGRFDAPGANRIVSQFLDTAFSTLARSARDDVEYAAAPIAYFMDSLASVGTDAARKHTETCRVRLVAESLRRHDGGEVDSARTLMGFLHPVWRRKLVGCSDVEAVALVRSWFETMDRDTLIAEFAYALVAPNAPRAERPRRGAMVAIAEVLLPLMRESALRSGRVDIGTLQAWIHRLSQIDSPRAAAMIVALDELAGRFHFGVVDDESIRLWAASRGDFLTMASEWRIRSWTVRRAQLATDPRTAEEELDAVDFDSSAALPFLVAVHRRDPQRAAHLWNSYAALHDRDPAFITARATTALEDGDRSRALQSSLQLAADRRSRGIRLRQDGWLVLALWSEASGDEATSRIALMRFLEAESDE